MLNFKELWIGDLVFIQSLNVNGAWEGNIDSNYAKIKIKGKIVKIELSDIKEAKIDIKESEALKSLNESLKDKNNSKPFKIDDSFGNTIDLHIEKLKPTMQNDTPINIFNHQVMRAEVFLKDAIKQRKLVINIIHGIGNGALKKAVRALLSSTPEVKSIYDKHGGGTSEIWLEF